MDGWKNKSVLESVSNHNVLYFVKSGKGDLPVDLFVVGRICFLDFDNILLRHC